MKVELSRIAGIDDAASRIIVASRDSGVLSDVQARDGLHKRRIRIEIRICNAAVPRPKAGVDGELGEVGEPSDLPCSVGLAARQGLELAQVSRLSSLRFQVFAQEASVAVFVVGVVVNILRHIPVKN